MAQEHQTLLEPTAKCPWSLEVTTVLPEAILAAGLGSTCFGCYGQNRWNCLGMQSRDESSVEHKLYVWYTPPSTPLSDQKDGIPILELSHPNLNQSNVKPLLAVQISPASSQTCYVYAANPTTGDLLLWVVQSGDLKSSALPIAASVRLPLTFDEDDQDTLTSLDVSWHSQLVVLVGTAKCRSFWIQQTNIPVSLHAQLVHITQERGLISRFLGSASSPAELFLASQSTSIEKHLLLDDPNTKGFLSVTKTGKIIQWTVKPTETFQVQFEIPRLVVDLRKFHQGSIQLVDAALRSSTLHVLYMTIAASRDGALSRLFWLQLSIQPDDLYEQLYDPIVLDRYADPARDLQVIGLRVSETGTGYAVVTVEPDQNANEPIPISLRSPIPSLGHRTHVVALGPGNEIHEVDLNLPGCHATILPGSITTDWMTHGICLWDASGVGLRLRLHIDNRRGYERASGNSMTSPETASSALALHLNAMFDEHFNHPKKAVRVPPSLFACDAKSLELAAYDVAKGLQMNVTVDLVELQLSFVKLLQESSLFRRLDDVCRWRLLSIGQEVSAYSNMKAMAPSDETLLNPTTVAEWIEQYHDKAPDDALPILIQAVEAANVFRTECASKVYDVPPNNPPKVDLAANVPIWTSHKSIKTTIIKQLALWDRGMPMSPTVAEAVAEVWLQVRGDDYVSCPTETTRNDYIQAQRKVFPLLRQINGWKNDQFLFELCVGHCYFGGICAIVLEHENRGDRTALYKIELLANSMVEKRDVESGYSFGRFVLQWFMDRKLFGHVFRYGAIFRQELADSMMSEKVLKPFSWIHGVQQGNYADAVESILSDVELRDVTLSHALTLLGVAKLANSVRECEPSEYNEEIAKLRRTIDKKRELAIAQGELFGENFKECLKSPDVLLDYALDTAFISVVDLSCKAEICLAALAISSAFDTVAAMESASIRVWAAVISADQPLWQEWLEKRNKFENQALLKSLCQDTIFGRVLDTFLVDIDSEVSITNVKVFKGVVALLNANETDLESLVISMVDALKST